MTDPVAICSLKLQPNEPGQALLSRGVRVGPGPQRKEGAGDHHPLRAGKGIPVSAALRRVFAHRPGVRVMAR